MSDPAKAVFLSYASQDAEAAKKICDALRSSGVEVWFDAEGGLEHGDEWDAKIRRQIKECVLFLPIISANTEAREEGYFRIEWELAAQRALGIASGVAFILPIVIDDTKEPDSLVPDRFRAVQWTRARGGELTPEVKARFLKLWSHRAGVVKHQSGELRAESRESEHRTENREPKTVNVPKPGWKIYAGLAVAMFAVAAGAVWWLRHGAGNQPVEQPKAKPVVTAAQTSEARQLAEQARTLFDALDSSRDDFKLAEELLTKARAKDNTDAEVEAAQSQLDSRYLQRGWDPSDVRREAARASAQRAVRLDPQSFEARLAVAFQLGDTDREGEEKVQKLQDLRRERPADQRLLRALGTTLNRLGQFDEGNRVLDESAALPGGDPLALYNKSLNFWFAGRTVEAERAIQASIAQRPFVGALLISGWYAAFLHGDTNRAREIFARIPAQEMQQDRAAFFAWHMEMLAHRPGAAVAAVQAVPRDWLNDSWYRGPRSALIGDALSAAGRQDAAVLEWRNALKLIDERLAASPASLPLQNGRIRLLASLGEEAEAEKQFAVVAQRLGFDPVGTKSVPSWVALINIRLGRKTEAIRQISAGLQRERRAVDFTAATLRLDPVFDPLRGEPEFAKVIAEAEAIEQAAAAAAGRDWPKDPELKRVLAMLDRLDAIPEDFRLAEEVVQKALDKSPTDPEVVAAMARVQSMWLLRGWDTSEERLQLAKKVCERAVQLAPDLPEALGALGVYLFIRGGEGERSRQVLERAIALAPEEPFYQRMLGTMYNTRSGGRGGLLPETLPTLQRTATRFPRDPLAQYDLSRIYRNMAEWVKFEQALDATLALAPVANALVWKARAEFAFRDNLPAMKATLDRVPPRVRAIERTVFTYFIYAVMSGRPDEGLEAVQMMSDLWMADFDYRGPKALLTAELLKLQGKPAMARLQYEAALVEVQKRKSLYPGDAALAASEAWVLHGLGRDEEARAVNKVILETIDRPYRLAPMNSWWFTSIPLNLILGERVTALQLIREAVKTLPSIRSTLRQRLQLDARMAPFRDDPEIRALLAEPGAPPSPARQLTAKARLLLLGTDATREDYALAEEYCQQALKLEAADGEVWATYSQVHGAFVYRGWDTSPERREQVRLTAERAIRLAPDSVQAKIAQAGAWNTFGLNRAETEKLLRDVVAEEPDNQQALRFLAVTVLNQGKLDECLALNERSAALPGGDALALFNNSRYLWQRGRRAEAYAFLQRSLAQKPFSGSLTFKTMLEIVWRGDLAAAEETLRQIPQATLLEDRANYTAGLLRYYQQRPARAIEAWGKFPRDYYMDFIYDGPKGLLIGLADEMDHRDAAAKIEWRTALALVEKRIAATPTKPEPYYYKAYLLACLGEKASAEETLRTYEELAGIKYAPGSEMTFENALVYVRLGRLDEVFAQSLVRYVGRVRVDPRMEPLRADPRYAALLAEYEKQNAEAGK